MNRLILLLFLLAMTCTGSAKNPYPEMAFAGAMIMDSECLTTSEWVIYSDGTYEEVLYESCDDR